MSAPTILLRCVQYFLVVLYVLKLLLATEGMAQTLSIPVVLERAINSSSSGINSYLNYLNNHQLIPEECHRTELGLFCEAYAQCHFTSVLPSDHSNPFMAEMWTPHTISWVVLRLCLSWSPFLYTALLRSSRINPFPIKFNNSA